MPLAELDITNIIDESAYPLSGGADYDDLLRLIGGGSLCLLGEASHGTHEFYRERAEITKRLIKEQNFNAVAVEADWPDAFRVTMNDSLVRPSAEIL